MKQLSMCREGEVVTIKCVRGSSMIRKRLIEMGFLKGAQVAIVKYAPLRDPVEVRLGDTHLSLRVCEAVGIDVEPIPVKDLAE